MRKSHEGNSPENKKNENQARGGCAISPTRAENYPQWYQEVIKQADLAENSSVRGCMVIKPWGYALWENMQSILNKEFKKMGHQNAYFPLFIPLSYLEKEAKHVEGFAKECAVVTHHRLGMNREGKLIPMAPLEEPLVVRPTSETIIGESFAKWIQSYRDLPLKINQWANVVRWEMRPRIFLRTAEFLWQEGHTAHATAEEALDETKKMLTLYRDFAHKTLAIPVIFGEKSDSERFPGAVGTYTIEAMMQDRKALQGGTSHFLGQTFSKSFGISFRSASGEETLAWTTSWGVTTRLIGALIMTHSDDDGLVLPPRIAPLHIVIVPVLHKQEHREEVVSYAKQLHKELSEILYEGKPLEVLIDERDERGGEKMWQWIKKGVPLRIEVGPRDIEKDHIVMYRRIDGHKDKTILSRKEFVAQVTAFLDTIQQTLYQKALEFRDKHTVSIDTQEELEAFFTADNEQTIHGGFALIHWNRDPKIEADLKDKLGVTVRCIPFDIPSSPGTCLFSGQPSPGRVVVAKAY